MKIPFHRFTDRARRAAILAGDAARSHPYIAPEHLLLAIVRDEHDRAAHVMQQCGTCCAHTAGLPVSCSGFHPAAPNANGIYRGHQRQPKYSGLPL